MRRGCLVFGRYGRWLLEARSAFLDEMGSEEGRRVFKKFVAKWNDGELAPAYYAGIKTTGDQEVPRTRHVWGFAAKLDKGDQARLDAARDGVDSQTHRSGAGASALLPAQRPFGGVAPPRRAAAPPAAAVPRGPVGPVGPSAAPRPGAGPAVGPAAAGPSRPAAGPADARLAQLQAKERAREEEWKRQLGL